MSEPLGILNNKSLYLISFDLDKSKGREGDYLLLDRRIEKLGLFAKPTMQIRLLVHRGNASTIRNSLRAATILQGPRKGLHILQPLDRIFVMKLQKSAAWNRLKQKSLTELFIEIFS